MIKLNGAYFNHSDLISVARRAADGKAAAYCFLVGLMDKIWEETRPTRVGQQRKLSKSNLIRLVTETIERVGKRRPVITRRTLTIISKEVRTC